MTVPEPEIDRLLVRVAAGDSAAINELLDLHRQRLNRMVSMRMDRRLGARIDASDVVQEALAEAFRQIHDYQQQRPVAFYPWLRQITWNRLVDLHRKHVLSQKRSVNRECDPFLFNDDSAGQMLDQLAKTTTTPSSLCARNERTGQLHLALNSLSPPDRELIVMRHLERMSTREVAAVLDISEGAVKTRLVRALKRLRDVLAATE